MQILVLEASTSAAKALVYDADKGVVAVQSVNYSPEIDHFGAHDAHKVYLALMEVGRQTAAGHDIQAIGLGDVWHSIIALDKSLHPQSPAYLWNFTAHAQICRQYREQKDLARQIYHNTGCMPNITYPVWSLKYMEQTGLDLSDKIFASQACYNFLQLTGEFVETRNVAAGMGILNTHTQKHDELIMQTMGIEQEQYPRLGDYHDIRPLRAEAAALLGVRAGIPVAPGHSDGALNQLGNGALAPGRMTFSVGTSAAIRLTADRPVLSSPPATWCYTGVDGWMAGAATNGACNCINWFKEKMMQNKLSFRELESELLSDAPTPVFLPFVFGERNPGWQDTRRGGFLDISGDDSPATLFRAVSQGVLFNVYQCYIILRQLYRTPDRIILSGGILNSRPWIQMAADIFQCDLYLSDNAQASMLGSAALALHAAGALPDLHAFGQTDLECVHPDPATAGRYGELYQKYLEYYYRCM